MARSRTAPGFTLIELLVVVAIIAVLISILLPSLNQAKRQARQVICGTNLKSVYQAQLHYSISNRGWIIRGLENIAKGSGTDPTCTGQYSAGIYQDTPPAVLPYLNYTGMRDLRPGNNTIYGAGLGANSIFCYLWQFDADYSHEATLQAIRSNPLLQCPDFPPPGTFTNPNPALGAGWDKIWLNYVTTAFPLPYTDKNIAYDQSYLEWAPDAPGRGVPLGDADYVSSSRIDDVARIGSTGRFILSTEATNNIQSACTSVWFFHIFLTSHLPFAGIARIAQDQRHPGGINNLFFDGHVKVLPLSSIDCGYPNPIGQRLRWFTVVPNSAYN